MLPPVIVEPLPACGDSLPTAVAIPSDESKRSDRRSKPARLIARAALKRRRRLATGVFICQRATVLHVRFIHELRIENVRDAFRVRNRRRMRRLTLMVVDDVMTTGTALSEWRPRLEAGRGRKSLGSDRCPGSQGTVVQQPAIHAEEEAR